METKETMSTRDLCNGLPKEFAIYFHHVGSLGVDDKPKYSYLRKIFRDLFIREGFEYDQVFDWTVLRYSMAMQGVDALA